MSWQPASWELGLTAEERALEGCPYSGDPSARCYRCGAELCLYWHDEYHCDACGCDSLPAPTEPSLQRCWMCAEPLVTDHDRRACCGRVHCEGCRCPDPSWNGGPPIVRGGDWLPGLDLGWTRAGWDEEAPRAGHCRSCGAGVEEGATDPHHARCPRGAIGAAAVARVAWEVTR